MNTRRTTPHGFTLVEVLVVVAIIGLLTGVGVPVLMNLGRHVGEDMRSGAREVTNMIRAAQTYSMRNNVDAGVVYTLAVEPDSQANGMPVPVFDGMAMVRRLRSDEYDAVRGRLIDIYSIEPDDFTSRERLFIPVTDGGRRLTRLPDGLCILPQYDLNMGYLIDSEVYAPEPAVREYDIGGNWARNAFGADRFGLRRIKVLDLGNYDMADLLEGNVPANFSGLFYAPRWMDPTDPDTALRFDGDSPLNFAGHVFRPTGVMDTAAGRARFELKVGRLPSWEFEDRFVYEEDPPRIIRERGHIVEVFATSGRVRLASQ